MLVAFVKSLLRSKRSSSSMVAEGAALLKAGAEAFRALDFERARDYLLRARAQQDLDSKGLYLLGAALLYGGYLGEAEEVLSTALQADPDNADAWQMLATRHLLGGNWREGYRLYETWRHEVMRRNPDQTSNREWLRYIDSTLAGVPAWRGGALAGKKILVWSEQGHGDAIMTLRLLPTLRERCGASEVAFLSTAAEKCLFDAAGGGSFVEAIWEWKPKAGEFDVHCSIISLLHLLDVNVDNIPGRVPYLYVPEAKRRAWRNCLRGAGEFKVGLAWAGIPGLPFNALRSLTLTQLSPLFASSEVTFYSLQKHGLARAELKAHTFPVVDLMDQCDDFMDTAALIENLDLVISVDTAVAHLAGAMGKPVWLLNRYESEWRWMRDREDSVWYPSMRIFSQSEPRKWELVIDRVEAELRAWIGSRRPDAKVKLTPAQ